MNSVTGHVATGATASPSPVPEFMVEQVQRLHSLIDTQKDGNEKLPSKNERLFDTDAFCHMTATFEVLKNARSIDALMVGLPNGNKTMASKIGLVRLGPNIVLKEVLLVPKMKMQFDLHLTIE